MLGTQKIVKEVECLPVEERALVVDCILRTLNPVESEIEKKWIDIAKQRLAELRSGQVQAIPGDEVFAKVGKRFACVALGATLKIKDGKTFGCCRVTGMVRVR